MAFPFSFDAIPAASAAQQAKIDSLFKPKSKMDFILESVGFLSFNCGFKELNPESLKLLISKVTATLSQDVTVRAEEIQKMIKNNPSLMHKILSFMLEEEDHQKLTLQEVTAYLDKEPLFAALDNNNMFHINIPGSRMRKDIMLATANSPEALTLYFKYWRKFEPRTGFASMASGYHMQFFPEDRPDLLKYLKHGNEEIQVIAKAGLMHLDAQQANKKHEVLMNLVTGKGHKFAIEMTNLKAPELVQKAIPCSALTIALISFEYQHGSPEKGFGTSNVSEKHMKIVDLIFDARGDIAKIYRDSIESQKKLFNLLFEKFLRIPKVKSLENYGTLVTPIRQRAERNNFIIAVQIKKVEVKESEPKPKKKKKEKNVASAGPGPFAAKSDPVEEKKEVIVASVGAGAAAPAKHYWFNNTFNYRYSRFVKKWFYLKPNRELPFRKYAGLSSFEQEKLRQYHAFSRVIDKLVEEPDFTFRREVDVAGGKKRIYFYMKAHFQFEDKSAQSGYISYIMDGNDREGYECFHRFFSLSGPNFFEANFDEAINTIEIPTDVWEESEATEGELPEISDRSKEEDPFYHFVQVEDRLNGILITIFKRQIN